jgi:hypothetical protein
MLRSPKYVIIFPDFQIHMPNFPGISESHTLVVSKRRILLLVFRISLLFSVFFMTLYSKERINYSHVIQVS